MKGLTAHFALVFPSTSILPTTLAGSIENTGYSNGVFNWGYLRSVLTWR